MAKHTKKENSPIGCTRTLVIVVLIVGCCYSVAATITGVFVFFIIRYYRRSKRFEELIGLAEETDYDAFREALKRCSKSLSESRIRKAQQRFIEIHGLPRINCNEKIARNRPCFYQYPVLTIKTRQSAGRPYLDFDNGVTSILYIFPTTIEFISPGHRVVQIDDILEIQIGSDTIAFIVKKMGVPITILCPDPLIIAHTIETLQQIRHL